MASGGTSSVYRTGRNDSGSGSEDENDKELVLNEYDKTRQVVPLVHGRSVVMSTKLLSTEFTCPICLDLLTNTMTTKDCLHRFCYECISQAIKGNRECPTCRTKLVSMRNLRHDRNFDEMIKRIYPDRRKYEDMLEVANQEGDDALSSLFASFVDEDDVKRDHHVDVDAPTPPALLGSSRATSPMEMEEESGRKTPPWITAGDLDPRKMDAYEKKLYMQAQKAYLKLKSTRLGSRLAGLDRIFDCDVTETYSKTSRKTISSPSTEAKTRDDAKSKDSSDDSGDSEDSDNERATIQAELDEDQMEEEELMDDRLFLVQTSREVAKKLKEKEGPSEQSAGGTAGEAADDLVVPPFDPRTNPEPPYPDALESFAELMPNGKGATWQPPEDNNPEQQEDDLDEEEADQEADIERLYAEKKPEGVFSDLGKHQEKKDKYMCPETKLHLREINELRAGSLADLKATLEDTEQFELGEATAWYAQIKDGEEMVYYEKNKQPITRGRRGPTAVFNVDEEVERLGRKITLKDIRDDMSNTDSGADQTPCTLSLASSPPSSVLELSDIDEEKEKEVMMCPQEAAVPVELPPLDHGKVQERLHSWIGDVAPNTPEHPDTPLDRSMNDSGDEEDCESLPEDYEIETELRPSATLLARPEVPPEVLQPRFIRTQNTTTVEHLGEFLYQRWLEDIQMNQTVHAMTLTRPDHFYVFNRLDRHCNIVMLYETLATAQNLTARDDHLVIYFDIQRAEINSTEISLLAMIVPAEDREEGAEGEAAADASLRNSDSAGPSGLRGEGAAENELPVGSSMSA
ncbi:hypothetical protein PRIPAC_81519 [Pristionchus pacificus]|uniref:RING-type E3 ubiquitin transferase n=1 Tax=Pristionchus pacificus TaxID=54126 RepID=A0A2A6BI50_PRIPA|nr:hypothetical protein PRIPAC_81519 [Pristionchus pacificus]|eukprot:PDM65572.1 zinc finger protein [Pristionchus pacificus]